MVVASSVAGVALGGGGAPHMRSDAIHHPRQSLEQAQAQALVAMLSSLLASASTLTLTRPQPSHACISPCPLIASRLPHRHHHLSRLGSTNTASALCTLARSRCCNRGPRIANSMVLCVPLHFQISSTRMRHQPCCPWRCRPGMCSVMRKRVHATAHAGWHWAALLNHTRKQAEGGAEVEVEA